MRKFFVAFFAMCISLASYAGNTVTVVSGKEALKTAYSDNAVGTLEIDWSKAQYDHG